MNDPAAYSLQAQLTAAVHMRVRAEVAVGALDDGNRAVFATRDALLRQALAVVGCHGVDEDNVAPVGEVTVRPRVGYQIMLGAFPEALVLFGIWWNPIVQWSQQSLAMLHG